MTSQTAFGEICEFIRGVTFASGEGQKEQLDGYVACLTTSGVQEEVNWPSRRFIPHERVSSHRQMLQVGDILVSTANSKELVGKSCIVQSIPFPCTFGAFVTVARPKEAACPKYLAYWMRSKRFLAWCYRASSNTTNISNLRVSELSELPIPLPPLDEQKRIAARLDKADRLRRTRRYAQGLGESFLQSVFLEMFGDPATNPMGWDTTQVGKVFDIQLGKMLDAKRITGQHSYPYLGNSNVQWGYLDLTNIKYMDFPDDYEKFRLKKGDILVCEGGEVGRTAIWNGEIADCCYQKALHRLRPKNGDVDALFFLHYMRAAVAKGHIARQTYTATIAHFTAERFNDLSMIRPPLERQKKFAEVVRKVERLRAQQREAERQADYLFQTLLHQAFSQAGGAG